MLTYVSAPGTPASYTIFSRFVCGAPVDVVTGNVGVAQGIIMLSNFLSTIYFLT